MIRFCVCDQAGQAIFRPEDEAMVGTSSALELDHVFRECNRINVKRFLEQPPQKGRWILDGFQIEPGSLGTPQKGSTP